MIVERDEVNVGMFMEKTTCVMHIEAKGSVNRRDVQDLVSIAPRM